VLRQRATTGNFQEERVAGRDAQEVHQEIRREGVLSFTPIKVERRKRFTIRKLSKTSDRR
jgi:hypothetical protein